MLRLRDGFYWADIRSDGKRYRQSLKTADKKLAEKLHAKLEAEIRLGTHKAKTEETPAVSLGTAYDRLYKSHFAYLKSPETARHNWATVQQYLKPVLPVPAITTAVLQTLVDAMRRDGHSPAGINRKLSLISRILRDCVDRDELPKVPKVPYQREPEGRNRVISAGELNAVLGALRAAGKQLAADALVVLADTGCRVSEVLRIDHDAVNYGTGVIHIWRNKAEYPRSVPMTPRVQDTLAALATSGYFKSLTRDSLSDAWEYARREVGLDGDKGFVMHALRHTAASDLVSAGVELFKVKEFLGHKSIQTTLRYAHLDRSKLAECADVLAQRDQNVTRTCPVGDDGEAMDRIEPSKGAAPLERDSAKPGPKSSASTNFATFARLW